jgi:hypothetical protein
MSGVIVLDGKISKLPYPLYPKFKNTYTKGYRFHIPPLVGPINFQLGSPGNLLPNSELELLEVTVMQSGFDDMDYWSLYMDNSVILDTIYTKELGQIKTLKGVKRVDFGQSLELRYNNVSGTSKVIWVDLDFMSKNLP